MFENRKLVIATKHKKESVISPLIEKALKVECFVPDNFDTDKFGTFSGEIERNNDALSTVRDKCLLAMKHSNCDLGIASEGSFGEHPTVFFANANEEFLIFIDQKNNLEIVVRELSLTTNFDGKRLESELDLIQFATKAQFPSHGLILKDTENNFFECQKDFENLQQIIESYHYYINKFGVCYVETDMRAMHNPTRMLVIEKATQKLIEKIKSYCPECQTPGFGVTSLVSGLRCEMCNMPTKSVLAYIYECEKCKYILEKKYPNNKTSEDPTFCDFCNP